jgi:iron(II)-dependent oxidoreductase
VPTEALAAGPLPGDVEIPGGTYVLGARPNIEGTRRLGPSDVGDGFVFDNEKWAREVEIAPYRIARAPVTNIEFAAFVDANGYLDRSHWSDDGWSWRTSIDAAHPVYWHRGADRTWLLRRFRETVPLPPHEPVIHVNWHEAQAYCRWAGRRLPSEAEWELAASGYTKQRFPWGDSAPSPRVANLDLALGRPADVAAFPAGDSPFGCRQMIGNVWEWTSSRFAPYPGFVADPYKEYSEPWFASPHMVLRGGCFATRGRLLRNTWRNFYPPHRRDVLAGFRTCAADRLTAA